MSVTKLKRAVEMMMRAGRMHRSVIDARVKDVGIHRTQHRILMRLAGCEKLPSQKEMAEHLDVTPAAVCGALKKLEDDGYVERSLGHDNRFNELRITDKGRELVALSRELFAAADTEMFDGFTEQELDAYISALEKICSNLERQERKKTI